MGTTSAAVVNYALQLIATQKQITDLDDGSVEANAAAVVYKPIVQLLLREIDPDFAQVTAALALSGAPAFVPWTYEYVYPATCLRLRQVRPQLGAYDPNDPQPVRSAVAFDAGEKVILTNQPAALAVYTSSAPTEAAWDTIFAEAVARRLANPLAMALSGRPDFADKILEQAAAMTATCETTDDGTMTGAG